MINYEVYSYVYNCMFYNNQAGKGGAVYNMNNDATSSTFTNCGFVGNYANGRGGAFSNDVGSDITITDCIFFGNSCSGKGGLNKEIKVKIIFVGAIYDDFYSSPTLIRTYFTQNFAYVLFLLFLLLKFKGSSRCIWK